MSCAVQTLSFQDLIEAVEAMPLEDQSLFVELINKRIIEKRRAELVADVQDARRAFESGDVKRGSFKDLMKDLKDRGPLSGTLASSDPLNEQYAVSQIYRERSNMRSNCSPMMHFPRHFIHTN